MFAGGPTEFEVLLGQAPAVELHRGESHLEPLPDQLEVGGDIVHQGRAGVGRDAGPGGSQEFVDRFLGDPTGQVPQRHVDHGQCARGERKNPGPKIVVDLLAFAGIPADQDRCQVPDGFRRVPVEVV